MTMTEVSLLVLSSLFTGLVVGQEKPDLIYFRPVEGLLSSSIRQLVEMPPEAKEQFKELENNRMMTEECLDKEHCFDVILQEIRLDCDCCCPTFAVYYRPKPFKTCTGIWIPLSYQWTKGGKCYNEGEICHKMSCPLVYARCQQFYRYETFVYFNPQANIYLISIQKIPDYCVCPCDKLPCRKTEE